MTKADEQLRQMAREIAKDSIVMSALAKFLEQVVRESVQAGKADVEEALRVEREAQADFRLQNDREWKSKVDLAKAQAREFAQKWRNDAFEKSAEIAKRYGQHDAAADIMSMVEA